MQYYPLIKACSPGAMTQSRSAFVVSWQFTTTLVAATNFQKAVKPCFCRTTHEHTKLQVLLFFKGLSESKVQ